MKWSFKYITFAWMAWFIIAYDDQGIDNPLKDFREYLEYIAEHTHDVVDSVPYKGIYKNHIVKC